MLSIRVADTLYATPSEQVQHIDYVDTLTLLPFTQAPIEGLAHFNGHPFVQIDVARALGLTQGTQTARKRLIISTQQGHFALRVTEVLNLAHTSGTTSQKTPALSELPLNDVLPALAKSEKKPSSLKQISKPSANVERQQLPLLLVASGDKTVALLTHNIDHIQDLSYLQTLGCENFAGELLIKNSNDLLPTQSLGQTLGVKEADKLERLAVIVGGESTRWALLVERAIRLETIQQIYCFDANKPEKTGQVCELTDLQGLAKHPRSVVLSRLWYINQAGEVQELMDAEYLRKTHHSPLPIRLLIPPQIAEVLSITGRSSNEGLRINCGTGCYLLPLTMATHTLKEIPPAALSPTRLHCASTQSIEHIPWINTAAFLFGQPSQTLNSQVVVTLSNGNKILLGVDHVTFSRPANTESWTTIELPYPAALFFDAAFYDHHNSQWILRTRNTIKFADLPWGIKKSLVKAIIGWVDASAVIDIKTLPD